MEASKLNLDRCILFPKDEGAVHAIENKEIDNRYKIEVIDLNYSQLSKLRLFGFFDSPDNENLNIANNDFVKVDSSQVSMLIEKALETRKRTNEKELLKLIDKFVEKAKRSDKNNLPIWFNT